MKVEVTLMPIADGVPEVTRMVDIDESQVDLKDTPITHILGIIWMLGQNDWQHK